MEDLARRFEPLGLSAYLDCFESQSFDSWPAVLDITEQDLIELGVHLGHRRKLQRAIATERGLDVNIPLLADAHDPTSSGARGAMSASTEEESGASINGLQTKASSNIEPDISSQSRRKYKRRQKRDPNRPERPLTGYVRFSRDRHKRYRHHQWSFAELAKRIGEDWRDLDADLKNEYLTVANDEWDTFRKILEQEKVRQTSACLSPQSAAYHNALMAVNNSFPSRHGNDEPSNDTSMSSFSILSPPQSASRTSPKTSLHINSPTPSESATSGVAYNHHHPTLAGVQDYLSTARHAHPRSPPQGIPPWPTYPAPQSSEDMLNYYPLLYAHSDGSVQSTSSIDMAMMRQRQDMPAETVATISPSYTTLAGPGTRNLWASHPLAMQPGTPDSANCHASAAPATTARSWDMD